MFSPLYERIYTVVQKIPFGRVAPYGLIARLTGIPRQARLVGYALHSLPDDRNIPWHRVINAKGEISRLPDPDAGVHQRQLLEAEGVSFDKNGRIDLLLFCWKPDQEEICDIYNS